LIGGVQEGCVMDLKLRGKVVLVTGSSRGIGLATARAFAAEGCRVMLSARSTGQLRETETALRATGAEVAGHAADVGSPDDAARLIEATVAACWQRRLAGGAGLRYRLPIPPTRG
jgi:NAD(P)-dependent dehydrogenase (short-subunit alcohol dehydrogenase family)